MTANIQVSGKYPDGRIFVIGGGSFDEFNQHLVDFFGGEAAGRIVEDFSVLVDPPSPAASPSSAPSGRAAGGPSAPSAPGAPTCAHGPMQYFEAGTNKAGKRYSSSWRCISRDRNDQCKAKWNDD